MTLTRRRLRRRTRPISCPGSTRRSDRSPRRDTASRLPTTRKAPTAAQSGAPVHHNQRGPVHRAALLRLTQRTRARWLDEALSPSEVACEDALGVHWFRFPARGDLVGGALVPPVRVVLPEPRRASRRAWHRSRPRDPVSVGAAVHAVADRRGPAVSAPGRGPLVPRRPTSRSPGSGPTSGPTSTGRSTSMAR